MLLSHSCPSPHLANSHWSAANLIASSLVSSNARMFGISVKNLNWIESIQNKLARVVTCSKLRECSMMYLLTALLYRHAKYILSTIRWRPHKNNPLSNNRIVGIYFSHFINGCMLNSESDNWYADNVPNLNLFNGSYIWNKDMKIENIVGKRGCVKIIANNPLNYSVSSDVSCFNLTDIGMYYAWILKVYFTLEFLWI